MHKAFRYALSETLDLGQVIHEQCADETSALKKREQQGIKKAQSVSKGNSKRASPS